jgi:hypothetical protein
MRLRFAFVCLLLPLFSGACSTITWVPVDKSLRDRAVLTTDPARLTSLGGSLEEGDTDENECVINIKPINFPNFTVTVNFDTGTNNTTVNLYVQTASAQLGVRQADEALHVLSSAGPGNIKINGLYSGAGSQSVDLYPWAGPGMPIALKNFHTGGNVESNPRVQVIVVRNYDPSLNPNNVELAVRREGKQVILRFERHVPPEMAVPPP